MYKVEKSERWRRGKAMEVMEEREGLSAMAAVDLLPVDSKYKESKKLDYRKMSLGKYSKEEGSRWKFATLMGSEKDLKVDDLKND